MVENSKLAGVIEDKDTELASMRPMIQRMKLESERQAFDLKEKNS